MVSYDFNRLIIAEYQTELVLSSMNASA